MRALIEKNRHLTPHALHASRLHTFLMCRILPKSKFMKDFTMRRLIPLLVSVTLSASLFSAEADLLVRFSAGASERIYPDIALTPEFGAGLAIDAYFYRNLGGRFFVDYAGHLLYGLHEGAIVNQLINTVAFGGLFMYRIERDIQLGIGIGYSAEAGKRQMFIPSLESAFQWSRHPGAFGGSFFIRASGGYTFWIIETFGVVIEGYAGARYWLAPEWHTHIDAGISFGATYRLYYKEDRE
jgi:hypothetical protein